MGNEPQSTVFSHMGLQLLFSPFRYALILFFMFVTIFFSSLAVHYYYGVSNNNLGLLATFNQEYQWQIWLDLNQNNWANDFSLWVNKQLRWLVFDASGLTNALRQANQDNQKIQHWLFSNWGTIQSLETICAIMSVRLGNVAGLFSLHFLFQVAAIADGIAMRNKRRATAGRESAGIYHRAKYFRKGIFLITLLAYMGYPNTIHPALLLIPIFISAIFTHAQFKFWKKYL